MYTFKCQECGKKFKTTAAAEKASNDGCPKCGGVDIDVDEIVACSAPLAALRRAVARGVLERGAIVEQR